MKSGGRIASGLPSSVLYRDNSGRQIEQVIADLCVQFKRKIGRWLSMVWLSPAAADGFQSPEGLAVHACKYVAPGHYLVRPLTISELVKTSPEAGTRGGVDEA